MQLCVCRAHHTLHKSSTVELHQGHVDFQVSGACRIPRIAPAVKQRASSGSKAHRAGSLGTFSTAAPLARSVAAQSAAAEAPVLSKEGEVLKALEAIMDPDFGMNIVECGFVKDLQVDPQAGSVAFRLELTTPACPIKDQFEKEANSVVTALPWVSKVR